MNEPIEPRPLVAVLELLQRKEKIDNIKIFHGRSFLDCSSSVFPPLQWEKRGRVAVAPVCSITSNAFSYNWWFLLIKLTQVFALLGCWCDSWLVFGWVRRSFSTRCVYKIYPGKSLRFSFKYRNISNFHRPKRFKIMPWMSCAIFLLFQQYGFVPCFPMTLRLGSFALFLKYSI